MRERESEREWGVSIDYNNSFLLASESESESESERESERIREWENERMREWENERSINRLW